MSTSASTSTQLKLIAVIASLSMLHTLQAQSSTVRVDGTPVQEPTTVIITVSPTLFYVCQSGTARYTTRWQVTPTSSTETLLSIVVSAGVATVNTSAAHGLNSGNGITVSGSTQSLLNTTSVILSTPTAASFTFSTTAPNGTYNNSALAFSTTANRTNAAIWSIKRVETVGSTQIIMHAGGAAGSFTSKCSDYGSVVFI